MEERRIISKYEDFSSKRDKFSIYDISHLDWHPVGGLHPPVPLLHLLLCPLPPIIVHHHHAWALTKSLDSTEVRSVGTGGDVEDEGREEEEGGEDLEMLNKTTLVCVMSSLPIFIIN